MLITNDFLAPIACGVAEKLGLTTNYLGRFNMSNDAVNVQEFLAKCRESGQLDDALLRLVLGTTDFSIKEEGKDRDQVNLLNKS